MTKMPKIDESLRSVYPLFKSSLGKPEREKYPASAIDFKPYDFLNR